MAVGSEVRYDQVVEVVGCLYVLPPRGKIRHQLLGDVITLTDESIAAVGMNDQLIKKKIFNRSVLVRAAFFHEVQQEVFRKSHVGGGL